MIACTTFLMYLDVSRYRIGIIMTVQREKFSSQLDPELLTAVRDHAQRNGRQFQSVLEQALSEYLDRHLANRPRTHVMEALGLSMDEFTELYEKLAQ